MTARVWAVLAIAVVLSGVCYGRATAGAKIKTVSISGRAKDATGAAIGNGVVTLLVFGELDATAKTYIRQDGTFAFPGVPPRIYYLVIEVPGFNIFRKLIFAERGNDIKVGDLFVQVGYHGDDAAVRPLVYNGIEYSAGGDGEIGYITATDIATGKELWAVQLFRVRTHWWRGKKDTQWVFISGLELNQNVLVIETERSPCYRLDLSTKRINTQQCVKKP